MKVTLTGYEMLIAAHAGVMRQVEAIRAGLPGKGWDQHIEEAGSELAVCKATGLYWDAVVKGQAEIGSVQIRSSRDQTTLAVLADDPDDALYIFVTGALPQYTIEGAIAGDVAKELNFQLPGSKSNPHFIPAERLDPIDSFDLQPVPMR